MREKALIKKKWQDDCTAFQKTISLWRMSKGKKKSKNQKKQIRTTMTQNSTPTECLKLNC
jgi:hypothetical protein